MCALRAKLNYRGRVAPEMSGYRLFIGKWWERLFVIMLGKLNATGAIFPCFYRLYFTDFFHFYELANCICQMGEG